MLRMRIASVLLAFAAGIFVLNAGLVPLIPAASAQVTNAPAPGITVSGTGTVRAAPDRMLVRITLYGLKGSASAIDDAGRQLAVTLRAHGIPDAAWVLPLVGSIGPSSSPAIIGSIAKPTRQKVEAILRDNIRALPDAIPSVTNFSIQSFLTVDDCTAAERSAQRLALDNARARASSIARDEGLSLGKVVAVSEPFGISGGCPSSQGPSRFFNSSEDQYGSLEIPITVSLTVSFAIR